MFSDEISLFQFILAEILPSEFLENLWLYTELPVL